VNALQAVRGQLVCQPFEPVVYVVGGQLLDLQQIIDQACSGIESAWIGV